MEIKEKEEVQAKGIGNMFNKIIAENFPPGTRSLQDTNQI
jgi:hypothetical protein